MKIIEQYIYVGSNRRSDYPVIEQFIELKEEELTSLSGKTSEQFAQLSLLLEGEGVISSIQEFPGLPDSPDPLDFFCHLYTHTAILLQRYAHHNVQVTHWMREASPQCCRAVFQYEERTVGEQSGDLALLFLSKLIPGLEVEQDRFDPSSSPGEWVDAYFRYASPLALPADTQAIIDAAVQSEIPYLKIDRYPFAPAVGDFRVRENSALKLGHCHHQHIIDGTFCVDRSAASERLIKDRVKIIELLNRLGLRLPLRETVVSKCSTVTRALRSARRTGYPLMAKAAIKNSIQGLPVAVANERALRAVMETASQQHQEVILESYCRGRSYKILIANRQLIGVINTDPGADNYCLETYEVHSSLIDAALDIARELDVGMLALGLVSPDISVPLPESSTVFIDLDIAPQLDSFLPSDSELRPAAAKHFIRWLFPDGALTRVPIVAVTGTNGKTTTSRMIYAILKHAGYRPGLACTEGVYGHDYQLIQAGDLSGSVGHFRLLGEPGIDCAVFETARGGIADQGFAFDFCNVGVCLNVTRDHLGDKGITTLEQMAELKRTIVERARDVVVLNADCPLCLSMLPFPTAKKYCLVSTNTGFEKLRASHSNCHAFAVLEDISEEKWMVLYVQGRKMPLIAVSEAPATFQGLVEYNISNALHAGAACYMMGVGIETVKQGLSLFEMNFENTPGRLNIYEGHPFRVIMDFAHNADGFRNLCNFIDKQDVIGRKIIMVSLEGKYREDDNIAAAAELAGHFDYYICRNYSTIPDGQSVEYIPELLKASLCQTGVPEHAISTVPEPNEATHFSLEVAEPGDLLILLVDEVEFDSTWNLVTNYEAVIGKSTS